MGSRRYAVMTTTGTAGWMTSTAPATVSFQTRKTKPRLVADLRYMGVASVDDLMAAIDRFYMRRGCAPDRMRVSAHTLTNLRKLAKEQASQWATIFQNVATAPPDPDNLTFMGVKVTL